MVSCRGKVISNMNKWTTDHLFDLKSCVNILSSSSLSFLGPQCSMCMLVGEEQLDITKCGRYLHICEKSNCFLAFITDTMSSFQDSHRTVILLASLFMYLLTLSQGTSTFLGFTALLLKHLFDESHLYNKSELLFVLNILEEFYTSSCQSLVLYSESDEGVALTNARPDPERRILHEDAITDDVDWFFDSTDTSPYIPPCDSPVQPDNCESNIQSGIDNMFVIRGLQHALMWEFDNSQGADLSLPMQLANDIWEAVSPYSDCECRTSAPLCNSQLRICGDENCVCATDSWLCPVLHGVPPLSTSTRICSIQGCRPSTSVVYQNSIVLFCEKDSRMNGAAASGESRGSRLNDCCRHALEMRGQKGFISMALVDMAVLIDDNTDSGAFRDGSGASQQALDIHVDLRVVYSTSGGHMPPLQPHTAASLSSLSGGGSSLSYLARAMTRLEELGVDMLLCVEPLPSKLVDACSQRGICVLAGTKKDVHDMSRLVAGTIVVEDILDLEEDCVSTHYTIDVQIIDDVRVSDNDDGGTGMEIRDSVMFVLTPQSLHHTKANKQICGNGLGCTDTTGKVNRYMKDPVLNKYLENYAHSFSTVVLRTPSCAIGRMLKDRVQRCLSRIDHAFLRKGGVIPGAGVPELVCALRLKEERYRLQAVLAAAATKGTVVGEGERCGIAEKCRLIARLESALEDFAYIININNGISPPTAMEYWHQSATRIADVTAANKHSDHSWKVLGPSSTLLNALTHLSAAEKCQLLPPIRLNNPDPQGGTDSPILDIRSVRVEAMRTAIYVVKTILNTACIITNTDESLN